MENEREREADERERRREEREREREERERAREERERESEERERSRSGKSVVVWDKEEEEEEEERGEEGEERGGKKAALSFTECGVCEEQFDDVTRIPLVLICSHFFCKECLQKRPTTKSPSSSSSSPSLSIRCPYCDLVTPLPLSPSSSPSPSPSPSPLSSLPVNTLCLQAVASLCLRRPPCGECASAPSDLYCSSCEFSYCGACSKTVHAPKALSRHAPIPIQEKETASRECCVTHGDRLSLYCPRDNSILCIYCKEASHKTHDAILIEDAHALKKKEIEKEMEWVREGKGRLERHLLSLFKEEENLRDTFEETKSEIEICFQRLLLFLMRRKQDLIDDLSSQTDKARTLIQMKRLQSAEYTSELDVFERLVEASFSKHPLFLLRNRDMFGEKTQILLNREVNKEVPVFPAFSLSKKQSEDLFQAITNVGSITKSGSSSLTSNDVSLSSILPPPTLTLEYNNSSTELGRGIDGELVVQGLCMCVCVCVCVCMCMCMRVCVRESE